MSDRKINPLKAQEYRNRYIATVTFIGGEMVVQGGRKERKDLKRAKSECDFCFVKDIDSGKGVRLILEGGGWMKDTNY